MHGEIGHIYTILIPKFNVKCNMGDFGENENVVFVVVVNRICIVFILCSVSFIACVALYAVFCLSVVCYFV
jgi:hypothetical protein